MKFPRSITAKIPVRHLSNYSNPDDPHFSQLITCGVDQTREEALRNAYRWLNGKIIGPPMATPHMTAEQIAADGLIGVYDVDLNGDVELELGLNCRVFNAYAFQIEETSGVDREEETRRLKKLYGQNFEPDFSDSRVIGRYTKDERPHYRRRWVGGKYIYEEIKGA